MTQPTEPTNVLATLREVVPDRQLRSGESLRLAEAQANRLLDLFEVPGPFVPTELVSELPRIRVQSDASMPASGAAHWENGQWVITLNPSEPIVRQRFSLMHEFKHVLDHHARSDLYGDPTVDHRAQDRAEQAADQFAASLLMPRRWLRHLWFDSGQNLSQLAPRLGVSTRALSLRLWHLGLGIDRQRCVRHASVTKRSGDKDPRAGGRSAVPS